jgi:hypothetical protein
MVVSDSHRPRPRTGGGRAVRMVRPQARNRRPTWKSPCTSMARNRRREAGVGSNGLHLLEVPRMPSMPRRTWSSSRCAAAAATPMPPPCSDFLPDTKPTGDKSPRHRQVAASARPLEYRGKPIGVQHLAGQKPRRTASGSACACDHRKAIGLRPLVRARYPAARRHPPGEGIRLGKSNNLKARNPHDSHPRLFRQPLPVGPTI